MTAGRRVSLALLSLVAGAAMLLPARTASAHAVGVSSGEYRVVGDVLYGDLGMANRELARWLPAVDTDHDGAVDAAEMTAGRNAVDRALMSGIQVDNGGQPCPGSVDRAWVMEADGGAVFQVRFTCPTSPRALTLSMPMLAGLTPSHRHMARVFRNGQAQARVLDRAHARWTLDGAGSGSSWSTAWSMLKLGVEHILTGADHLVFLLGLILVGGRARSLIGVVTAFTVAHSLTLALAFFGVVSFSARWVETAIALSVFAAAWNNLRPFLPGRGWAMAMAFGLVHGLGFAGALRNLALPLRARGLALLAFNVGVELGQLAIVALLLPLLYAASRRRWYPRLVMGAGSLAIAWVAALWVLERGVGLRLLPTLAT